MKMSDYLSKEEIRYFTQKSDLQAAALVATIWAGILAIFYVVCTWTNPVTVVLAVILLGGRMLALAVLMHDCGHRTLFKSDWANQFFGQWFASKPIFQDIKVFSTSHLIHHRKAGTHDDPDLANYQTYPVDKASFKRKVIRDLTGQTGFKFLSYVVIAAAGIFNTEKRAAARPYVEVLLVQVIMAVILGLLFAPWAYLLWLTATVTSNMLIVRIRQIAEHAAVPDLYDPDPRNNSRTTIPTWWERLLLAPNAVNYHLEHHFMASVPCYKLKELHQTLRRRGVYAQTHIYDGGYIEVMRHALTDIQYTPSSS